MREFCPGNHFCQQVGHTWQSAHFPGQGQGNWDKTGITAGTRLFILGDKPSINVCILFKKVLSLIETITYYLRYIQSYGKYPEKNNFTLSFVTGK